MTWTWWMTLLAIFAALVLIGCIPVGVDARYNAEGVFLAAKLGPIRLQLLPQQPKKKKKQPKQILGQPDREIVAEEESVPDKGFWEVLEEMQNPKTTKQPVAAPKPKREQKKQQSVAPNPFLTAEKTAGRQSFAGNRLVVPPAKEESPLTDIEFDNAAELRKAVIYTEILNRKY